MNQRMMMRMVTLNRRDCLALLTLPLLAERGYGQSEPYAGQFVSLEATVVNLLGPGAANTQRFVCRTRNSDGVLRARQGLPVTFTFTNALAEDVELHFFGLRVGPEASNLIVPKGGEAVVTFTPPDAGTFWFGPLRKAARQREMGIQGLLIVDPATPDGRYADVPLVLDDWLIGDDGKIDQDFRNLERAAGEGRLGNWYTVNGQFKPRIPLSRSKPSRLRLLNACNSRSLALQFKGAEALLLARDGQPITPFVIAAEGLTLAPGQRADVVLASATAEQVVLALDLFEDVVETGFLRIEGVLPPLPDSPTLPANVLPTIDSAVVPKEIAITIEGGIKGGLTSAKVGAEALDLRGLLERGIAWAVNGIAGPDGAPVFEASVGDVLILAVENKTVFDQPLALHGHLWHQLALDGQPTPGQSWRDTAVVPALSSARYVMVAEQVGTWGLHSLVAERSDAGLFASFRVLDKP